VSCLRKQESRLVPAQAAVQVYSRLGGDPGDREFSSFLDCRLCGNDRQGSLSRLRFDYTGLSTAGGEANWFIRRKSILRKNHFQPVREAACMHEKITPLILQVKNSLIAQYGEKMKRVILYGSHARGSATQDSDIDLLVLVDKTLSPWEVRRV